MNKALASALDGAGAFTTSTALSRSYSAANVSIRNEYNRGHYDAVRPSERMPVTDRDIIFSCNQAYYNVGIVRNIVDLMADFCVKGIDWAHKNRNVEAFYKSWFQKIDGYDVSERFCNYLVRLGNTCVFTNYGKIPMEVCNEWRKTRGAEFSNVTYSKCEIPSSYVFLDITALNEVYGELGKFSNNRMFMLQLASGLVNSFGNNKGKFNQVTIQGAPNINNVISNIPKSLRDKLTENGGNLVLTEDDIKLFHYKKDDWENWAKPLLYSILEPLMLLQKMHLADMSALDGAISNIRLWKVGYIDQTNVLNSIIPTKAMLNKVREIVQNNLSGGVLDLFWGPDLDFKESNSQVHRFLGPEKYKHVMALIYDGMGVPPSLTAGSGGGSDGFTNNFISMKVLIEKLNYLRNKLVNFWTNEAKQIQMSMGFSSPAHIVFDDAILSDENQYQQLLLELYDRDIISLESVRSEFNLIDPIEGGRILRENKRRVKDKIPAKAGQFHNPMVKQTMQSDMIKNGLLDPTVMGLEVKQEDIQKSLQPAGDKGGRPSGAGDKVKRKDKVVRPRTSAELLSTHVWARESIGAISDVVNPIYLAEKNKAYIRELTDSDVNDLENIKFAILCAHEPFDTIDTNTIQAACASLPNVDIEKAAYEQIVGNFKEKFKRDPSAEDKRIAYAAAYSLVKNA